MAHEIRTFENEPSAAAALQAELVDTFTSFPDRGPRVVMLAGGATPIEVYQRIADDPPDSVAPGTWLLLSDDRHVPPDDERSNYAKIHPLAVSLGIPDTRVIHPDYDLDLDEAAINFGQRIAGPGRSGADFDLAILGIGTDGHTASLFWPNLVPVEVSFDDAPPGETTKRAASGIIGVGSGSPVFRTARELALSVKEYGGVARVSVTAQVLFAFRRLIFFVTGSTKREILSGIIAHPGEYTAGRVLMQHPNVQIWTDQILE